MENRQRQFGWLLALTSLGFFMAMMDSMIVTTASTAIKIDFDISEASLQWALNAYNVAIAATLLVGVALGDRFGRRRVYNLGILVFTLGSVFCALANRMPLLIVARVIAGIGASVMTPMSMAILTAAVPVAKRGKALGIWSGIGGLALIVGPALGGLIVAKLTWQWIFWINVPLGLIVIGLSRFYLPESTGVATPINLTDAGLSMLAMTAIIWALAASSTSINGLGPFVGLIIGLVAGTWFIKRQQHVVAPLMPLTLFKKRIFTMGNVATFLLYAAMYGVVFFLPQFLQVVQHDNAWEAGLSLLPWTWDTSISCAICWQSCGPLRGSDCGSYRAIISNIWVFHAWLPSCQPCCLCYDDCSAGNCWDGIVNGGPRVTACSFGGSVTGSYR